MQYETFLSQLYLDIADVIVVVINRDETVAEMNRRGCEILGYRKDEVLGKNWFNNFIPERLRAELCRLFHQMLNGEIRLERHENPVVTKNRTERTISWVNILVRDPESHVTGVLSSGEDITERRRLEDELNRYRQRLEQVVAERTSEFARTNARLEMEIAEHRKAQEGLLLRAAILDNASEALFVLSQGGDFVYANEAALKMYGFSRDEFLNMNLRRLVMPEQVSLVKPRLKQILETGHLDMETVHVRKNGTPVPVWVHHTRVKTMHGECIFSVVRDITYEFKLRLALEQAPGIVWTTDVNSKLTMVTGAGLKQIGLLPGEGVGQSIFEFVDRHGLGNEVLEAHRRALTGETGEFCVDRKPEKIGLSGKVAPLRGIAGEVAGTIGMVMQAGS